MDLKKQAAETILKFVENNQIIGVGSGSTVELAILAIAEKARKEKFNLKFVPTSLDTSRKLAAAGLTVLSPMTVAKIDWGFDGIDAIDSCRRAIKGKGGAMLKEKMMAKKCIRYYLVGDKSKFYNNILDIEIPVEVCPDASLSVEADLRKIGAESAKIRTGTGVYGASITENGNFILDVKFSKLTDNLESEIKSIVGVVESGLFTSYATAAFITEEQGIREL